ncbi:retinol dehydrogenase 12-like [Lycorma delicatula]|uniref:retinol dehydrogenase 12-like n=1 Tax=Lycorma delicatula TaxID=130591 RepID=UPI003F51A73C
MGLASAKCVSTARLDGKTAIITGCNSGIGKITAREFYRIGARVIMACRDIQRAEAAAQEIKDEVKDVEGVGEVIIKKLDLGSLKSVRECANDILETEKHIHLLVNNAGIMMCPNGKTEDGFETQFGVNHLGHFLFTCLLLPRIISSAPARIINLSSVAHERAVIKFSDINWEKRPYSAIGAYGQSKLANVLFTKELAERLKGKGVTTYAVHPGIVKTELGRHMDEVYFKGARVLARTLSYFLIKTPEEGAQTTLHCALDDAAGQENGLYYSDCKVKEPSQLAKDLEAAKKLWKVSEELVGLENFEIK